MAEIAASVLAFAPTVVTTLNDVGDKIKRQFIYLFYFASNIVGLENEANQLDDTIQDMQEKVNHEVTNNAREIHHEATSWFQASDEFKFEMNKIINEVPNVKGGCLKLVSRFSLSKRAKKISEAMAQHRQKSELVKISHLPQVAAAKEIIWGNTFSFDSRKEIEQDIMNNLRNKKANMIAIHGMGGLGKTTTAIRIMNALLNEKVFDEIVIVDVGQKVDVKEIQLGIGGSLGLDDLKDERGQQAIKRKLHDRLSAGTRRTLLLLDDIWEELKLETLGIPRGSEGCTILITSRNSDALKGMNMGHENIFEMKELSENDSWFMFSKRAGTCVNDNKLKCISRSVAKECSGLPIALEALGTSLQDEKNELIWEDTLNELKRPNPHNKSSIEKAYKPLKVSYEMLDEIVKVPFLLCCLFPENANISLDQMTYFYMGLGLFNDLGSLEDAKRKMYSLVKMLKDRSLLLNGRDENHVRIHDVVHDVCIVIAKEKGYIGGKDCSWISHIHQPTRIESSTELVFPKLRLLFSNDNEFNTNIFFKGIEELYVLSIKMNYSRSSPLPHTQSLKILRTLVLERCNYSDIISDVGDLVHLEILICTQCIGIKKIPQDIKGLKRLKLLDLTGCQNLQSIGRGFISSLVELEELKMLGSFHKWDAFGLRELQALTKLTCLEIQIANQLLVAQEIDLSSKIKRFNIDFSGNNMGIYDDFRRISVNNMNLKWDEETHLHYWVENLLKDAERLCLTGPYGERLRGEQRMNNYLDIPNYFPNIRSLVLQYLGIRSIETTSMEHDDGVAIMYPHMDYLKLYFLPNFENICMGLISSFSFQNLKHLEICFLPALKELWKSNTVMSLPQLVDIRIFECEMMEQLFVWSEEGKNITRAGPSNRDVAFPLLERIFIKECPKMKSIIPTPLSGYGDHSSHLFCQPEYVSFGSLKSLEIEWNPFCHHTNICASFFNGLEKLSISKYDGRKSLFVFSVARNLGNLKELEIKYCDEMVSVIENDEEMGKGVSGGERNCLFPNLETLRLFDLGKLVTFSNNDVELPLLKEVYIYKCPNMSNLSLPTHTLAIAYTYSNIFMVPFSNNENPQIVSFVGGLQKLSIEVFRASTSIFSWSIAENLVNLRELRISSCDKMVKVIESGEKSSTLLFPKLIMLELSYLPELKIFCESESEVGFPLMEKLKIYKCPKITRFTLGSVTTPCLNFVEIEFKGYEVGTLMDLNGVLANSAR